MDLCKRQEAAEADLPIDMMDVQGNIHASDT